MKKVRAQLGHHEPMARAFDLTRWQERLKRIAARQAIESEFILRNLDEATVTRLTPEAHYARERRGEACKDIYDGDDTHSSLDYRVETTRGQGPVATGIAHAEFARTLAAESAAAMGMPLLLDHDVRAIIGRVPRPEAVEAAQAILDEVKVAPPKEPPQIIPEADTFEGRPLRAIDLG